MDVGVGGALNMIIRVSIVRLLLSLILLLDLGGSEYSMTTTTSIYDHLQRNGLPKGILPKGITDYTIDATDGTFHVTLGQPCNAKSSDNNSQLHYDLNVIGTLSYGQIGNLSGVSAQELFLWFPVKCIRVDDPSSGLIHFDVGVVDKQFALSLFESPPDCTAVDDDPHPNPNPNPNPNPHPPLQVQSGEIHPIIGDEPVTKAAL